MELGTALIPVADATDKTERQGEVELDGAKPTSAFRVCDFCRDLSELKAGGFRCVLCDPREGDLIGV